MSPLPPTCFRSCTTEPRDLAMKKRCKMARANNQETHTTPTASKHHRGDHGGEVCQPTYLVGHGLQASFSTSLISPVVLARERHGHGTPHELVGRHATLTA